MNSLFITYLGFLNLGPTEIILILIVAVILFGGRLPEVAKTIGKVFFEFKRNVKDLQRDIYTHTSDTYDASPRPLPKPYYPDPEPSYVGPDPDHLESDDSEENESETDLEGRDALSEGENTTEESEKKDQNESS